MASYGKDLEGTSLLDVVKQVQDTPGIEHYTFPVP